MESRGSVVGIVTRARGTVWNSNRVGNKRCHLLATPLASTQLSVHWVTGSSCPGGVKWPGCEADLSPLSYAEVKNVWNYTSTPSVCI